MECGEPNHDPDRLVFDSEARSHLRTMNTIRRRRKRRTIVAFALGVALVAGACSNAGNTGSAQPATVGAGTPGVTKTRIIVGALATESGPLASLFGQPVYGAEAYFDYVNNTFGGVDGRKIDLAYNLDDAGSTTNDTTQVRNLVEQDHVFAVVGVSTLFFSGASFLAVKARPPLDMSSRQTGTSGPICSAPTAPISTTRRARPSSLIRQNSSMPRRWRWSPTTSLLPPRTTAWR